MILPLALLLALLISPGAAHAAVTGSIVFIKDHNVWIMPADNPDAARALTTDGTVSFPYSSPAMDDSGTVYAVASLGGGVAGSGDIVRLDTSGNVLGSFRPITIGTIYALSVSPDGETVGFTWAQSSSSPIGGGSVFGVAAFAGFAHADGSSSSLPTDLEGYQPSFSSNNTAVLSAYATHYSQAGLRTYQLGQAATQPWLLTCQELLGVCVFPASPDVSPQGERVVATGNDPNGTSFGTQKRLVVWEMAGAPPAEPTHACEYSVDASVDSPSWSPAGDALVWDQFSSIDEWGIYMAHGFDSGCEPAFERAHLVVPGGTDPYWSPASASGGQPTTPAPTGPGGFTDTAGSVHGDAIAALVEADITGGYPDGTFRPGASVTRGQMASFLARALNLPADETNTFSDVSGSVHAASIGALVEAEITGGYPDGTFRPGESVTRAQMATFLTRALDLPPGDASVFSDVGSSTHAASIGALVEAEITGGFPDGTFRPETPVTRGQMATFLVRALGL